MKNLNKVFCLLLALVLTVCFTGCEIQLDSSVVENPDILVENSDNENTDEETEDETEESEDESEDESEESDDAEEPEDESEDESEESEDEIEDTDSTSDKSSSDKSSSKKSSSKKSSSKVSSDKDSDEDLGDEDDDDKSSSKKSSSKKSSSKKSSSKKSSSKKSSSKNSSDKSSVNSESSSKPSSSESSSEDNFNAVGGVIGGEIEEAEIWDGSVKKPSKGNGQKETPYFISSPAEFAYALSTGAGRGHYYQLTCDIYLNDVSDSDWMLNKNNNAWFTETGFTGHLDGNGYCVYGVWINPQDVPRAGGLIPWFTEGSITNLGVRASFIVASEFAGGIVGRAQNGGLKEIKNCFTDESVCVWLKKDEKTDVGCGGILGHALDCGSTEAQIAFENCYTKAQLRADDVDSYRMNGIIGIIYNSAFTMKNCYSLGSDPYHAQGDKWSSLLLKNGYKSSEVFVNLYGTLNSASSAGKEYWTKVSEDSIKGEGARSKLDGFDFDTVWETVDGSTPKLRIFNGIDGKDLSVKSINDISADIFKKPAGKPAK